ncbi:mannonate dehydratase [Cellvibrio japonicus]|uniref:mannonate dehydratase n=1 Tax=Cellvibrio japonicus TaxID=155077 RepID=UPI0011E08E12|nr:mannonate dehydratase [Cellvibrio japonicus]QEI11717.1 mannonate dehydratase [Cellvibrio japonicus]QEI15291.1 mannonate dehydratase [Cellvibrio japonicus]QEI18871.1 mannonate dehydratase [Cellvibrio japonicus]
MKETWRWFGPNDSVSLQHIAQAGASGIVTSLHHIPTGAAWPLADIQARKKMIEDHGLEWAVVESVPLHNDIKTRTGNYHSYIENYKTSLRNLAAAGVYDVCYNFMPVVDWTRTNLSYTLPNKSQALRFEMSDFAAYDAYILQRPGAEADYQPEVLAKAKARLDAMGDEEKQLLEKNIIAGLPGGEGSYNREGIRAAIDQFIRLGNEGMRANLFAFLREIIPVAEEVGIRMAIHPDDPPFSLFGLPRVVSTADDARALLQAAPSPANGLTLCAGSYGARCDNDLVAMAREFGDRIYFVHLRNIKREDDGSFYESDHLDGDNDMVGLVEALLDEEDRRRQQGVQLPPIAMRPDHGHLMGDEIGKPGINPGYSYAGRMKGLAELRGVIHALTSLRRRRA